MDIGATFPALPNDKVEELGLPIIGEHAAEIAEGPRTIKFVAQTIVSIEDQTAESYIIARATEGKF